jgi:hypothetical protein
MRKAEDRDGEMQVLVSESPRNRSLAGPKGRVEDIIKINQTVTG